MTPTLRRLLVVLTIAAFALVAAACDNSSGETTTTSGPTTTTDRSGTVGTTTTMPPLVSIPPEQIPGTHSPSIPDDVALAMRADIGVLMLVAEESRALPFLQIPTVTILDLAAFQARVAATVEEDLDPVEIARDQAFYELLGMLDGETDLGDILVSLYSEQVAGFYDGDTGEIVVPAATDGFSAFQKITIVHELVHALTDQHFDFNDEFEFLDDAGNIDEVSALLAVVEGDATYQQLLYLEDLDPFDAADAVREMLSFDQSALDSVPSWVAMDLSFPYDRGLAFMAAIIADGGLKGVDEVYQDLPTTSEQILEPRKYLRREHPLELPRVTATLPGWEIHQDATMGEWGVRLILTDTLTPGMLTQAAAGWGNDSCRVFINGDDVAMAWSYLAESEQDAEDLVNALISHARGAMGASSSTESGGGLILEGGGTYVFIDRMDDRFVFIASTVRNAGGSLRTQMGV
ncbi:MAG: hypothetical protein O3B42_08060 [Actinomycetota bacterium]|nr:hypothetical protein [Actinomycetota bacterium]